MARFGEQLRADESSVTLQLARANQALGDQLEGAIGVANPKPEHTIYQRRPRAAPKPPPPTVAATNAVAGNDVVLSKQVNRLRELGEIKLSVAVREEEVIHPRAGEARS